MGRSQSTPGLIESRGKVALEDMWVPPTLLGALSPTYPRSLIGSPSPPPQPTPDSPGGSTSSVPSHHQTSASHRRRSGALETLFIAPMAERRVNLLCLCCRGDFAMRQYDATGVGRDDATVGLVARGPRVRDKETPRTSAHRRNGERRDECEIEPATMGVGEPFGRN